MSSQQSYYDQQQYPPQSGSDATTEIVGGLLKVALLLVVFLIALPLLVPLIVWTFSGGIAATKLRYWTTPRWWWVVVTVGILMVVGVLAGEVAGLSRWITAGQAAAFFHRTPGTWAGQLWPTFWPAVVGNLLLGVALAPAAFSLKRRRIAAAAAQRHLPDVMTQERVERARRHAPDYVSARQLGVRVDTRTGQIIGASRSARTAPRPVAGGHAFGLVTRPLIRTLSERFYDFRRVRDWIDRRGRWMLFPKLAALRALLLAESGTGKTTLLESLIFCALEQGIPVVMIDAKGDPKDAREVVERTWQAGRTAVYDMPFNLFVGTAAEIRGKIVRLVGENTGEGRVYTRDLIGVLDAVQGKTPLKSIADLRDRIRNPGPHVRDDYDLQLVEHEFGKSGETRGTRVLDDVMSALRPIEPLVSENGWSYDSLPADLTIVPLRPGSDPAHAALGDMMLYDLRRFMGTRMQHGTTGTPLLVIVDEFAQLVTADSDPGDTAASLFETARSAGLGLVLAAQSVAGLSNDPARRQRALSSGAALLIGRTKDPDEVVGYAGTIMRQEASGGAYGEELRSARAQHSYALDPNDVRESWDGAFWIVQAGGMAQFRVMPPATRLSQTGGPTSTTAQPASVDAAPAGPSTLASYASTPAPIAEQAAPSALPLARSAEPAAAIVGLVIDLTEGEAGHWQAVAWPATRTEVLDDEQNPESAQFTTDAREPAVPAGRWSDEWTPGRFHVWGGDQHQLPVEWVDTLDQLLERAKARYQL
ncbi:hypothetical protein ACFOYW_17045 [Gryllotalpicola reticulitermitis]|uniref:AAA+ ATPase domain-containing protein n=1 Tax=Gryllotalpicola reticulitermitis TaxID=1184153 RepID=A0ABV8Q9P2_9MICO